MQISKNFNIKEFESKDGTKTPAEAVIRIKRIANELQILRTIIDQPIIINSGYRSKEHNKKVGGVENSLHLIGLAVDIHVKGLNSKILYLVMENLIKRKIISNGGLGLYDTFVHYDLGDVRRWDNRNKKDGYEIL